jgi:hypothetical protein
MDGDWVQIGMFWATVGLVAVSVGAAAVSYFLLRSQVDPHIVVYTKHDEKRASLLLIVIENVGRGVAYDVRFSLSRPIPARAFRIKSTGDAHTFDEMDYGPLIHGIPLLAPGERRVITWGQYGGLIDALGREPVRVVAHFRSRRQFPWDPTDHQSESLLEVHSFAGTDASQSLESRQVRELERMAKEIARIQQSVRSIAETVTQPMMREVLEQLRELQQKESKTETVPAGDGEMRSTAG